MTCARCERLERALRELADMVDRGFYHAITDSEKDKRVAALEKMFEEAPHAPNCAEVLLPVNPNPGARCDCWKHDFLRVYAEIGRG